MPDRHPDAAAMSAPYDFEEFQRRTVRAAAGRRSYAWSAAAAVAVLGLVVTLAVVTQRSGVTNTYAIADPLPATVDFQVGEPSTRTGAGRSCAA